MKTHVLLLLTEVKHNFFCEIMPLKVGTCNLAYLYLKQNSPFSLIFYGATVRDCIRGPRKPSEHQECFRGLSQATNVDARLGVALESNVE